MLKTAAISDILAEFHQPRSGIELLVDQMLFPNYGQSPVPDNLYTLAEISARSLLNRIHHTMYFTNSLTIYAGRTLEVLSEARSSPLNPNSSLLRVCEELGHQLESWYESLPAVIRPQLALAAENSSDHARQLRLRYESARMNIYRPFVIYVSEQHSEIDVTIPDPILSKCSICVTACRAFLLSAGHVLSRRTPYTYSIAQW
jgi:hypothetical protein